jgi:hypothetical protein
MNVLPIIILGLVCAAVILLYCNRRTRARLESIRGLLDILNIVTALGVFVSLYYTVAQFKVSQKQQERQELQGLAQVLTSLALEFDGNIDVCRKILADESNYTAAVSVPDNIFHCDVTKQFVTTGLLNESRLKQLVPDKVKTDYVSERRLGATLWNTYHTMLMLNDIMNRTEQLMTFQVLARTDNEIRAQTDFRLKGEMGFLVEKAKELQERLKACRPFIVELRDKCSQLAKEQ